MMNQAGGVSAVPNLPVIPASTQFDVTGFLQSATLDQACLSAAGTSIDAQGNPQAAHCGGTMVINGQTITVPNETVVILPASALTWQELFTQAPAPYAPMQTGMALNDNPKPLTTYEFQAVGNRVIDPSGTNGCTIQPAAIATSPVSCMSPSRTSTVVPGTSTSSTTTPASSKSAANSACRAPARAFRSTIPIAARHRSNSRPTGRYTRGNPSPDVRFQVDQDNPTIISATGYPMCIPRVLPPAFGGAADDAMCPQANRPISTGGKDPITGQTHPPAGEFDSFFTTTNPNLGPAFPDPKIQSPMEIGDYVNTAGSVETDANGTYISAHTVVNNTAIFTTPGTDPAYVMTEVALIGTGGLTVFGAGEAVARTRFEGMTTDPTRNVRLYGIDINPAGPDQIMGTADDGATADRDWGSIGVDPGPPNGAVKGRWRFRPPCTVPVATDKKCVGPAGGSFLPPTREVRAVIEGHQQFNADGTANPASQVPGTPTAQARRTASSGASTTPPSASTSSRRTCPVNRSRRTTSTPSTS